ncbi:hypothetical protein K504DRAFT_108468 [Pleomassaria siparia CBS 279.74]|uniref:Uncharacterized protein n=1 Tax=Pleomassaria siparia CBS 279.74 TaxID=1314801 RepID=A0A6G1JY06_9PLEO|nr:hypothetical protein K504DRAFT_108468 [Pleomassaria siparia CBS 279.74]
MRRQVSLVHTIPREDSKSAGTGAVRKGAVRNFESRTTAWIAYTLMEKGHFLGSYSSRCFTRLFLVLCSPTQVTSTHHVRNAQCPLHAHGRSMRTNVLVRNLGEQSWLIPFTLAIFTGITIRRIMLTIWVHDV